MRYATNRGKLFIRFVILLDFLCAMNLVVLSETTPSEGTVESTQSAVSYRAVFRPEKPQTLDETYHPIRPSQRLRWFLTSTIGPAHVAGVSFVSACGTSVDRPREYGTHWSGFPDRVGSGMAGSAAGNAMEAGVGLLFREDPHYFRLSRQPFKARLGNSVRLAFLSRGSDGSFGPAYARYMGIVGGNFLSNSWRVHSEANVQSALLRSAEGFAGRVTANAFGEFWPDVKKYIFHGRYRGAQSLEGAD